ncbi:MAG: general secretion pathway protein, partial [Lachnospiraceae bacterium]|nr:general secretion pathway protein [Lachnospiraceae bacterium]
MNNSYYGLSCNPFDKHSILPKQAFISEDHKEAVAALDFLKDTRGIGVLTASPGMGKSFALRCFE